MLFERHFDEIHRYLRRRLPGQAEEIASDVFTVAFDARRRFRPHGDSALPWLYGIASNLLFKRRRTEARELRAYARSWGERPPDVVEETEALERADAERRSAVLAAALARLSAADRNTLLLYALADLSYDEVAAALDVPVGTVRSRLARARRRCAPALETLDRETVTAGG